MSNNRFLSNLGLARRAGKLIYGFDSVKLSIDKIEIIYISNDLSTRTRDSIKHVAQLNEVEIADLSYTMYELGYAIGTKPVGIIGVADKGFTKLLTNRR